MRRQSIPPETLFMPLLVEEIRQSRENLQQVAKQKYTNIKDWEKAVGDAERRSNQAWSDAISLYDMPIERQGEAFQKNTFVERA